MARPRGTPKPQARNHRPRRSENRENLASLTSEVLRLCLKALNLPITGSKAQLVKRLGKASQLTQRPLARTRKQAGRVRKGKGKGKSHVVRPAVAQPDPITEDVAEATDDSSSVSSQDDFDMPLDVDPVEQSVLPDSQTPFTTEQLAAIQQTVQQSIAEAMYSHRSQVVPTPSSLFIPFLLRHLARHIIDLAQPHLLAFKGLWKKAQRIRFCRVSTLILPCYSPTCFLDPRPQSSNSVLMTRVQAPLPG